MNRWILFPLSLFFILATTAASARILNIGRPTTEVNKEYARLHPIAVYLAERLEPFGFTGGEVRVDGKNSKASIIGMLQNGEIDKEMTILHATEFVPRMLVIARPDLSPELMEAVTEVFVGMHETEAGREALQKYKINRFFRIDDREAYVRRLEERLRHLEE